MLKASLPRWCATSPMARHTWPVRVAAIPLHATTIRETHCTAATHTPLHAPNRAALALALAFWRFGVLASDPSRAWLCNPTACKNNS